ncbi:MAG: helix-turn-helix domain-containing protein [Dehalococcoidales bacterium]|nr:helix-turn-helix domain-containing protein [Dehalococcoidales bacterium]
MWGERLEITTEEVMKILNCSRQYVSELVKKEKLIPSGKRGKSYTFRLSELGKMLDNQQYLKLVIRIDELLTTNLPEIFELKPGWKVHNRDKT